MTKVILKYLILNNFSKATKNFAINYESHPNYPSLYAITDTLSLLGIENIAAKVLKEQFFELPVSFLSYFNEGLILVEKIENEVYITSEDNKRVSISFENFINDWNGIVLVVESNNIRDEFKNKIKYLNYLILIVSLLIAYFFKNQGTFYFLSFLGFLLSFVGFLAGIFVVEEKYGVDENQLTLKICSFSESTSCSKVIKSSSPLISRWVEFSDLPILFFASALISQLLNGESIFIISLLSILSLPLVAYSIWLQKVKIKKWCILCITVSSILLFLSILGWFNQKDLSFKVTTDFFIIGIIVSVVWFIIKLNISNNANLTKENLDLMKFKRNPFIFKSLLKKVSSYDSINSFNRILIGKKDVPINLTLILSPSCSHCHIAFEESLEIYKQFEDKINISILFNVNPNNKLNNYLNVVFMILMINKKDSNKILEAIRDWHIEKLSLEEWFVKWGNNATNNDFENEKLDLEQQYNWCQKNNFNFTPVRLVNDTIYPTEYSVSDIKYFISELEEITELV